MQISGELPWSQSLISVINDQNIQHFSPLNPSVLLTYLIYITYGISSPKMQISCFSF